MNNDALTFSRDLNLLSEDDLSTFFHELTTSGYPLLVSSEDALKELIHFGKGFLPDSAFTISGGMTRIYVRPKGSILYSFLPDILPILQFLYEFRSDNALIRKIKANLANPAQFDDTLFELKCLIYFCKNGFEFDYEPSVISSNNEKNPDFRLTKNAIELFVECKQIRLEEGLAFQRFNKNCKFLSDQLSDLALPKLLNMRLRLEINFKKSPRQPELEQLVGAINRLFTNDSVEELPLQSIGDSIEYLIVAKSKLGHFPVHVMKQAIIRVTDVPRGLSPNLSEPPDEEVTIYSSNLTTKVRRTLSKRISVAKHQLPDDRPGIIVIGKVGKTTLASSVEAITRKMESQEYGNIIAIVIDPFQGIWAYYRNEQKELLANLFQGFEATNPFVSN